MTAVRTYAIIAMFLPVADRFRGLFHQTESIGSVDIVAQDVFDEGWADGIPSTFVPQGIADVDWCDTFSSLEPLAGLDESADIDICPLSPRGAEAGFSVLLRGMDVLSISMSREFAFSYDVRGVEAQCADSLLLRFLYEQINDGKVSARLPRWRESLVRMLSEGMPGTDFDTVYRMLLQGFPGPSDEMRVDRLAKWLECVESPKKRGDVLRGETRYWINAGIYDKAVEAADRMQEAYPEYAIRAFRLRALAYASAGELALARVEISKARSHSLPCGERLELLYLEAWISLQDNDIELAKRNLRTILKETPNGNMNRKARHVLDSLEGNR